MTMTAPATTPDPFDTWKASLYRYPGTINPYTLRVLFDLDHGNAWRTGIRSDKKKRGTAINVLVTAEDTWQGQALAIVQVREAVFHPKRFTAVRKDYYLAGRNENGVAFAHPVEATARSTVRKVLAKVWRCDPRDLDDIERNGDVAFVPVRHPPAELEPVAGPVLLAGSHELTGDLFKSPRGTLYVRRRGTIRHRKGQHPTTRVRDGLWRIQEAVRAQGWGFTTPTAD